jgi:MFS family permease
MMVPVANRILIDLGPIRESRGFRLLFAGQFVEVFASQLTAVAIPFQVYALTRSSLQVGLVSLAQLVPLIIGALTGGSLGDAFDRRVILVVTSVLLALTSGGLAVNAAAAHPSLAALYLVSAAAAGLAGTASTASNAAVPSLVAPRHLVAAYSATQAVNQVGQVIGPALAGLLIEAVHLPWVYAATAVIFLLTAVAAARLPAIPPAPQAGRPGLASIVEGLRYLRGRQAMEGAYLIDVNAMVFGMPRALFPALAVSVFHGGARTLGYLYAAPAAGALIGALTTGWLARVHRQAWAVIVAVVVWGAAIVAFGLVHVLWAALALLAIAGWADVISAVLRSTILQTSASEEFRSRVSAVQIAVVTGGPRLGDLEAGAVATLVSTEFSIVSGGLACIAGAAALAGLLPGFRRYDRRITSHAGPGAAPISHPDPGHQG